MCRTKWCYGDCEECEAEKKAQKEWEEQIAVCPHKVSCQLTTLNVKQDQCVTCGKIFNY